MSESTTCLVARGDSFLDEDEGARLPSPIVGVDDAQWSQFVAGMVVQEPEAVSDSNEVGMFAMKPRRLGDLGFVKRLARDKKGGRAVWVGAFVAPLTPEKFLRDPELQYHVFAKSMKDYAKKIESGEIERPPGVSLSGSLAVLHKAGPMGLKSWSQGERFPSTEKSYERVAGVF